MCRCVCMWLYICIQGKDGRGPPIIIQRHKTKGRKKGPGHLPAPGFPNLVSHRQAALMKQDAQRAVQMLTGIRSKSHIFLSFPICRSVLRLLRFLSPRASKTTSLPHGSPHVQPKVSEIDYMRTVSCEPCMYDDQPSDEQCVPCRTLGRSRGLASQAFLLLPVRRPIQGHR